jgi:hypothetical protein
MDSAELHVDTRVQLMTFIAVSFLICRQAAMQTHEAGWWGSEEARLILN